MEQAKIQSYYDSVVQEKTAPNQDENVIDDIVELYSDDDSNDSNESDSECHL